jgi:carbonic anhydrase
MSSKKRPLDGEGPLGQTRVMEKLLRGIAEFRRKRLDHYRETYGSQLAVQTPDVLFIACSDSRVVPNVFASTNPGDLFVVRNVGNLVCPCGPEGLSSADESEFAAIEFAITQLHVRNIVVCGHSRCGAMQALAEGRDQVSLPHLRSWLSHGEPALGQLEGRCQLDPSLPLTDRLAQVNALVQLDHLMSYELVAREVEAGKLTLHGWYFDVLKGDVFAYEPDQQRFVLIDEQEAESLIARLQQ